MLNNLKEEKIMWQRGFIIQLFLLFVIPFAQAATTPTALNDWQKLRCGTLTDLGDGTLKLYGTDYRHGNTIVSRVLYDFSQGSETKIKFMPDGAGKFSYVYAGITGVAGASGTTDGTWDGSLLLPENTWYYARIDIKRTPTLFLIAFQKQNVCPFDGCKVVRIDYASSWQWEIIGL